MVNTERMKRTFTELVSLYAPSKGEREVCEYLKKKLKSLGASKIIEDNDGSVNGGNCGNLIAVWNGNAPGLPSIALTAHMDCVEHCKDIEPILEGGVFTSKGDTILGGDDKAGVTAILEGIALMKEMYIPHGKITVIFTVQEEIGLFGSKYIEEKYIQGIDFGYVLDAELVGWLTRHYTDLRIYRAVETQFKQVVIFGRRVRQREQTPDAVKAVRSLLLQIGLGEIEAEELPSEWPFLPYIVPASPAEPGHFFRVTMEPEQFADEVGRLQGLWPSRDTQLGAAQQTLRPPARALSHWHLALALAAGAISGVVQSKTGRVLVVKGDTHKDKTLQREFTEREDGSIAETRILTDKFVPVIRAWDMTPGSATRGEVLTIR